MGDISKIISHAIDTENSIDKTLTAIEEYIKEYNPSESDPMFKQWEVFNQMLKDIATVSNTAPKPHKMRIYS